MKISGSVAVNLTCPLCGSALDVVGILCTNPRCGWSAGGGLRVTRGFYRHYKGGIYYVHGVSRNDDTGEQLVIYASVQGNADDVLRHRTLTEFTEDVELLDPEEAPQLVPRFKRMGAR